jgi:DNA-binding beta-propeller fold protein YncE
VSKNQVVIRGQRLFVTELGNNSLNIVNLNTAKCIQSISNNERLLNEPQSVIYIPELNRIFVSNLQDDTVAPIYTLSEYGTKIILAYIIRETSRVCSIIISSRN